jgi:hypothetical protein
LRFVLNVNDNLKINIALQVAAVELGATANASTGWSAASTTPSRPN